MLDALSTQFRLWRFQPQAVRLVELRSRYQSWKLASVDTVGIGHDVALCRLAKHLGEPYYGNLLGLDQVAQHHAWSHTGQLVDVTHQQYLRIGWNSFEQRMR